MKSELDGRFVLAAALHYGIFRREVFRRYILSISHLHHLPKACEYTVSFVSLCLPSIGSQLTILICGWRP